ncbi:heavy metal translocating P-type ATPase [Parachitinimonas caeni]|uniref:Heavy metal translocating P-type ATPase n=1 Tax=Parachitinimonas caeni TaxID=3031301 RepID=A0ABT7DVU6_9NEIS|nr:heavy metal translocating P-type ATPase [Parachitinimonas caeni]MDK2124186.1 heavy metal translocating P-type ATPase [Parachitinimonas caeni]
MQTDTSSPNSQCFHCGLPVPADAQTPPTYPIQYRQQTRAACCAGCQAVASTIIESGLDQYYAQRDTLPSRSDPLPAELTNTLKLYDQREVQASFVRDEGNAREAALILEGITCAACVWLNERHLTSLPGVLEVGINYSTHRARIRWDENQIKLSDILAAVASIGYRAHPYDPGRHEQLAQQERRSALNRLWIAGLSMMQVMMYAVPVYLAGAGTIEADMERLMRWASLILTLPVVVYSCWPFYLGVWRDAKARRVGMDAPVTLGVLAAFIASVHATVVGRGEVYFDSVSMFVFLLLGGRYLEMVARRKAGAAAEALIKLIPAFAHRLLGFPANREPDTVTVASLKAGDILLVKPGETFPADGEVLEGRSSANESLLTGESRPIAKTEGASVIGGAINLDSPLIIRATQVGQDTQLSAIVRLLDRAMGDKPRLAQLADRVAAHFVLVLLIIAAIGYGYWHGVAPEHALPITVAVLVISCPCALSLATPAALTAATGWLAGEGLLVTRGHALESLAHVTDAVFDKTGTLTHGEPRVLATLPLAMPEGPARELAAALEAASEHPLAKAIRHGIEVPALAISDVANHPGAGIEACLDGQRLRIGHPRFVADGCAEAPPPALSGWQTAHTIVALANESQWLAAFALGDGIRPEAADALQRLRTIHPGITLHLVSGDASGPVLAVAGELGIPHQRAEQTPAGKLEYVQNLQAHGRRVLMVGDGINDAPVLAAADVSIAVAGGADLAQTTGDLVLIGHLGAIADGVTLGRRTRTIIAQNLWWSLGYNLVAIPFALSGLVTPWLASLGMAGSSLLVVVNALRLAKPGYSTTKPRSG